jgi:IS1 family transposase
MIIWHNDNIPDYYKNMEESKPANTQINTAENERNNIWKSNHWIKLSKNNKKYEKTLIQRKA